MVGYSDFLVLARNLMQAIKERRDTVEIRTSISRSYCYTFHYIRENLRGHREAHFKDGTSDHQEAVNIFHRIGKHTLASKVWGLYDARNRADYGLKEYFDKADAEDCIREAEDIVAEVKKIRIV